tara:strand:+ start:1348 stop:1791 length:444 start_codon:yes stop_codon:yes gene_type:complete
MVEREPIESNFVRSEILRILIQSRNIQNFIFNNYFFDAIDIANKKETKSRNSTILFWEIIYFVAEGNFRGAKVSVSDIYLSLGVSKSTAIRCVAQLEDLGILEKVRDSNDRRRAVITLTGKFRNEFVDFLDKMLHQLKNVVDSNAVR